MREKILSRFLSILRSYARNPRHLPRNLTWRMPRTVSGSRTIFVLGSPRSGTTLLQGVLGAHSQLFSIPGETGLFSLQNIFARRHLGLSWRENQDLLEESLDLVDFFDRAVRRLEQRNRGRTFVEKTPQHVLRLPFLMRCFPHGRFVHVARDGRDCFTSGKSHPHIPQTSSAARFARYWRRCVLKPFRLRDRANLLSLRYEDFVQAPAPELERLMGFLGLEPEKAQLDPARFGRNRRGDLDEFRLLRAPITEHRIGRWRAELSEAEVRDFERVAGPMLDAYGYSRTR